MIIQSSNDHLIESSSTNCKTECRTINSLDAGVSGLIYPINVSLSVDDQGDKALTLSYITTNDLAFDQSDPNSQLHSHLKLPHLILCQSGSKDIDRDNTTAAPSYTSCHYSSLTSFTTPRATGCLNESSYDTTVVEDIDEMERDDNDEQIFPIGADVKTNQENFSDEKKLHLS